ncbi:MAG: glycosyltransferase [Burkholderiaceae bacterium]
MKAHTTIELLYIEAGGGHRATALALQEVMREQCRPWQVRRVDLMSLLDPDARVQRLTGRPPEHLYNQALARGRTFGMGAQLRALQALLALGHGWLVRRFEAHWRRTRPAMVVSLVPNFNRAIGKAVERALPGVPFVTVMTDLADLPPHFWIEPEVEQQLVCGSERAAAQALAQGLDPQRIHRTSGMVLHPDFYSPLAIDRELERARLGLLPGRPTAVVMFGGQGSDQMLRIERELPELQLVLMCGHNYDLARRLKARSAPAPRAVIGFTTEVHRHLQLGDLFIGKPGPGCLSEAIRLGLPVITLRNRHTLPQERYNTEWVLEHGLGRVLRSWSELQPATARMLQHLADYRAAVARIDNRAVFELPRLLERLLQSSPTVVAREAVTALSTL